MAKKDLTPRLQELYAHMKTLGFRIALKTDQYTIGSFKDVFVATHRSDNVRAEVRHIESKSSDYISWILSIRNNNSWRYFSNVKWERDHWPLQSDVDKLLEAVDKYHNDKLIAQAKVHEAILSEKAQYLWEYNQVADGKSQDDLQGLNVLLELQRKHPTWTLEVLEADEEVITYYLKRHGITPVLPMS